ncbi:MAG: hypothetical protein ACI959_001312 [Limisphaerales bacterium]|jgi:hypothetical protein
MKKLFILLILVGLAVAGAGYYMLKKKKGSKSGKPRVETPYPEGLTNTEGMLAVLQQKRKDFQDAGNFYANTVKFDKLNSMTPPSNPQKRMKWEYDRVEQALWMGNTDKSIELTKLAISYMDETAYEGKWDLILRAHLGMSYFRLAEQQNCISNHNPESCIIPFTENAVHKNKEGANLALSQYTDVLNQYPESAHARYMLNLAYITLGEYPNNVPEKWLISTDKLGQDPSMPRFKNIASDLGLNCFSTSGSANIEDFNNDGYLDVFTSGFSLTEQARLFFSDGNGKYNDVTNEAGLKDLPGGLNTTHADYDNDGDVDIFILRGGWWNAWGDVPNSLLRNNGNGTFTDVTKEAGLLSYYPTQTAAWADYNNDGFLDVFIGNESSKLSKNNPCELYINNGDGTFSEIAYSAGIKAKGYIKGVSSADYDGDGFSDIFISVYHGDNYLYHNNGDKDKVSFEDVTEKAGVAKPYDCFPAWFFDYDNDGRLDLTVLTFSIKMDEDIAKEYCDIPFEHEGPKFYWNKGDGTFEDRTESLGMNTMLMSMGSNFGDLDNDGWEDFYIGTGKPDLKALYPNRMFLNNDGDGFTDVTTAGGFGHLQKGHAIVFADMDGDGDQDIYAQMGGAVETDFFQNALYENPGFGNNWITLRVEGISSNRDAIGARVMLALGGDNPRKIYRTVSTGGSFGGGSKQLEIGLGNADSIEGIEIFWPTTGQFQKLPGAAVNQVLKITEGVDSWTVIDQPAFQFNSPEHTMHVHSEEHEMAH